MPRLLALPLACLLLGPATAAASITGVCPDGSIFIVQHRSAIPCNAAKEVSPEEVPPLRPEYLPRPYTWQVYREQANPNNPYNLIDQAREVRRLRGNAPSGDDGAAPPAVSSGPQRFGAPGARAAPGPAPQAGAPGADPASRSAPPDLALSSDEIRDLFFIVELSQEAAPARFLREDAQGEVLLEVAFAHSPAFETRWRDALRAPTGGSRTVLFSVLAHAAERFDPHFTFVQGHESFRPRGDDPAQMGFLLGGPGPLAAEDVALGYVVLPPQMDLDAPLDVYWNDRQLETTLRP